MEYKNTTKKDLILIGYGLVKAGTTIKIKTKINNANFKEVSENKNLLEVKIIEKEDKKEELINKKL
jgi:hypothetical protein